MVQLPQTDARATGVRASGNIASWLTNSEIHVTHFSFAGLNSDWSFRMRGERRTNPLEALFTQPERAEIAATGFFLAEGAVSP